MHAQMAALPDLNRVANNYAARNVHRQFTTEAGRDV